MNRSFTFADSGYTGENFTRQFIEQEFTSTSLSRILETRKNIRHKELANLAQKQIVSGQLSTARLWEEYISRDCNWISFKLGKYEKSQFSLNKADILLYEFGEDGWYGPIQFNNKEYLLRTYRVPATENTNYRWTVICELASDYVALMWRGFVVKNSNRNYQFEFWKKIPQLYELLSAKVGGDWKNVDLYDLILRKLWSKYNQPNNLIYNWRHESVRATSSGVALNARTGKPIPTLEIKGGGLQALSKALAQACVSIEGVPSESLIFSQIEDALTKTLMREWGTKSYEFSLKREFEDEQKLEVPQRLIKGHYYFGNGNPTQGQDSFPHIRCYAEWGGSRKMLNFLLQELRGEDGNIKSLS